MSVIYTTPKQLTDREHLGYYCILCSLMEGTRRGVRSWHNSKLPNEMGHCLGSSALT